MSQQHSNNQASHIPHRAAAHDQGRSGISLPAVSAAQKDTTDESVQDDNLPERSISRETKPFQLKPDDQQAAQQEQAREEIPPFQPAGNGAVIQRRNISVTNSQTPGRRHDSRDVNHRHLLRLAAQGNLVPNEEGCIDIGEDKTWFVPVADLISAVADAIDIKRNKDVLGELNDLFGELKKVKAGMRARPAKRKEREKTDPSPPRKKANAEIQPNSRPAKDLPEDDEKNPASPVAKPEAMQTEELSAKIKKPEEPLKFIAWNANHFGETGDLNEGKIARQIDIFNPQLIIDNLNAGGVDKEMADKAIGFLQVMLLYTNKLPLFSDISAVNKLMQAAHELNLLLKKLNRALYTERQKQVPDIIGSLKKHYMIEHSKHLMQVHANLIMGFNEVGKGVEFMQQKLEDGKDEKSGGIKVETGPKLQAISINVKVLIKAINEHNTTGKKPLNGVEKKDQYTDDDYYAQYHAYTVLGKQSSQLKLSQIEYYPIAFNAAKYKYLGSMAISTKGEEIKQTEINWTKNPYLFAYPKFRPIVVHKLARKDEDGNVSKNEVWYGMVHTSPKGDEFDRRKIYEQQLNGSLPKLKAMAKGMNAQLIIGGDYYIAEEALVSTPATLRNKNSRAKSASKDDVRMTSEEMTRENLTAGSAIGRSKIDDNLSTGKINEVRNLQHPGSGVPYNYKGALGGMDLQDTRSLTGTNLNETGLQSADYFILDTRTSKTFQTGVIDPFTGLPSTMESEDNEISNSWFSFSDHVPVMLAVSGEAQDPAVAKAFPSNKSHFNSSAHSLNPFDLRFLQVSNVIARLPMEKPFPSREVEEMKAAFGEIQKKRKTGAYTEEDMVAMNQLKTKAEKLLDPKDREQYISTAAFETSQSSNSYITTILQQIWTDILELQPEGEGKKLMDHIQEVRMIIKEDKINAAYGIGLDEAHEKERLIAANEIKPFLLAYGGQEVLKKLDTSYESIKRRRLSSEVKSFIQLKKELQQSLLSGLMTMIDGYLSSQPPSGKAEKHQNIGGNSALIKDITRKKAPMSSIRDKPDKDKGKDTAHSSLGLFTIPYHPPEAKEGGIPNRANDCFLNSVLQLLSLPAYDKLILDSDVRLFIDKIKNKETIGEAAVEDLRSYLFFLDRVATMGGQEDAAELLGQLMNEIDRHQLPTLQQQLQQHKQLFTFVASNTRTILKADNMQGHALLPDETQAEEWQGGAKTTDQIPENVLSIPVTGAADLIDWLNNPRTYAHNPDYKKFNTIEWAYAEENWFSIRLEREETIFKNLPAVLTISLKRFNKADKISGPFKMPQTFVMYDQGKDLPVIKRYELQGFIYHQGKTMTGGHYWAHKKDKDGNWWQANDAAVTPSDMGNTHAEGTFKHDIDNAYIYTYVLTGEREELAAGPAKSLDPPEEDSPMNDEGK